ncbi:MAG: c-type cytochrome [Gemmatimonadales bacterium]
MFGKLSEGATRGMSGTRSATSRKGILAAAGVAIVGLTLVQVAASPGAPGSPRHALGPSSVWDSVYSLAQAGRGESTYRATCATCHGDSLAGINDAPPLAGSEFHKDYDGNTLGSLFSKISNDMPSDNPGSLTSQQVAGVVAFVLKYNGYPAGAVDLPAIADSLAGIKFLPKP